MEFNKLIKVTYLSSPMERLTMGGKNDPLSMIWWREYANKYFGKNGIDVLNPVLCPSELNPRFIVRNDKTAIRQSDALLVNFTQIGNPGVGGKIVIGAGTIQEIIYGYEQEKTVVLFDENRPYDELPLWVRYHSSIICKTQKEAMDFIISINHKKLRDVEFKEFDDSTQEGF
mgnify:FL=1